MVLVGRVGRVGRVGAGRDRPLRLRRQDALVILTTYYLLLTLVMLS